MTYSILIDYDDVSINRIGSHCIENFFGHVRGICKDFDSYENFVRCSVLAYTNIILRSKFNIKFMIKKRLNIAGAKIFKDSGDIDFDEKKCSEFNVISTVFHHSNIYIDQFFNSQINEESLCYFETFLQQVHLEDKKTEKIKRPKVSSGMSIQTRCIGSFYEKEIIDTFEEQQEQNQEMICFLVQKSIDTT